MEFGVKNK